MSDRDDAGPQVHGRMAFDERDTLMAYLLRHPGVFVEAKQILTPEHFSEPYEIIWAVTWRACMDLYNQFNALPPKEILETDALSRIAEHPTEIPEDGIEELRKFLDYIFDFDSAILFDPNYQTYGYELLQKFLKERHWIDPVRRLMQEIGDATPMDVPSLLEDFKQRYSQVQAATASPIEDLVPLNGWTEEALTTVSTGFEFMDRPMGGGAGDGEVYGLLGTYGSGKTMLSCGIAAEAAIRCVREAVALRCDPEHTFHFTWETPPNDIRKRAIAYTAQIYLDHLNNVPYSLTLSRQGRRHPYEEELFPTDPRGEWERYNDTRHIWQTYHIADMRGTPSNPKAGSGGIDEIQAELEKYRRRHNATIDTVVIDYALVCCRRLIKARGWDPDRKLRHLLGEFGDDCRRLIATHFNCKVWVVNQLSGQANKRAPGARMSHADSAEATNFAENLWYCFCLGNQNRDNHTVVMECTKTRRSEGMAQPAILELQGKYARFVSADDRYMLDPNTHRIVRRSVGEMVAPGAARSRSSGAPRGRAGRSGAADALLPG
jgi:hypothetical protein